MFTLQWQIFIIYQDDSTQKTPGLEILWRVDSRKNRFNRDIYGSKSPISAWCTTNTVQHEFHDTWQCWQDAISMAYRTGLSHHFHGCSLWFYERGRRHMCRDNGLSRVHNWKTAARWVEMCSQVCRAKTFNVSHHFYIFTFLQNYIEGSLKASPYATASSIKHRGHHRWYGRSVSTHGLLPWPLWQLWGIS